MPPIATREIVHRWELETRINCIDYDNDTGYIACGHDLGVSVLKPREHDGDSPERLFYHIGQSSTRIRIVYPYLAAVHPDYTISLIDLNNDFMQTLQSKRAHFANINYIDLCIHQSQPLIVSTGDDQVVAVWRNNALAYTTNIANAGRIVKFFNRDYRKICIVERNVVLNQDSVRLVDWVGDVSAYTIYVGPETVQDVVVRDNGIVLTVGDNGLFKGYDLSRLRGSSAFTQPNFQSILVGATEKDSLVRLSSNGDFIGMVNHVWIKSYSLANMGQRELHGPSFAHKLGSQFSGLSITASGHVAASSGPTVLLFQA